MQGDVTKSSQRPRRNDWPRPTNAVMASCARRRRASAPTVATARPVELWTEAMALCSWCSDSDCSVGALPSGSGKWTRPPPQGA